MSCIVTYLNYNTWQTCVCACMHHTMCELDSMLYCLSFVHACIKIFIISQVHGCTYQVCVHICMNKMFSDTFMNNDIDRYMVAVALVKNATHMQTCFISNAYTLPYLFLNSNLAIEVLQVWSSRNPRSKNMDPESDDYHWWPLNWHLDRCIFEGQSISNIYIYIIIL